MSATDTAYGARLESLVLRPVVSGVVRHGDVSAVAWHGTSATTVTHRAESCQSSERLLCRMSPVFGWPRASGLFVPSDGVRLHRGVRHHARR